MNSKERLSLIDALLDGSISDADRLRIEAEMLIDAEVRRDYYRRVELSMLLEQEAAESSAFPTQHSASPSAANRLVFMVLGSVLAIAASILVAAIIYNNAVQPEEFSAALARLPSSLLSPVEPSASGFAVLSGQVDAVWSNTSFNDGDLLPAGQLHLKSGLAHIELFSGAQVVVKGESKFTIDSSMQMTMLQGFARAEVPEPAQGFRIKTNSGDIVDLGTVFSVSVDPSGADVHVIDGEVELQPQPSDVLRLKAGGSRRLAGRGGVIGVRSPTNPTVGPAELRERVRQKEQQRYSKWLQWHSNVESDPRLVAFYRFRSERLRLAAVENLAKGAAVVATNGTIVAAKKTANRWGQSGQALDFSQVGSRVRVHVPGEYQALTLLCWVKINSLDRWYNSLFLTDGHEDREPHWQLMNDGRIFFSVKVPRDEEREELVQPVFYSPSIWDPALSGRWTMLAVTYDLDSRMVTHYLNGKAISSETIEASQAVDAIRIGQASICNWNEPMYRTDPDFVLRNLNGTMDEFAIFSEALSATEILRWYETGNPND